MARHQCVVLDKCFSSKTEFRRYLKTFLTERRGKTFNQGEDFNFLMEVFKRHPEQERKQIQNVSMIHISSMGKGPDVMLIYKNGHRDLISWNLCVDQNLKTHTAKWLRELVKDQIDEFRKNFTSCLNCPSTSNLEVDHFDITFKVLSQKFLESKQDMTKWPDYHKAHAKLRVLCRDCHQLLGER